MKLTKIVLAFVATVAVGFPASVSALESKPLPAFEVQTLEAEPVSSSTLQLEGNWILVYVQPRCRLCRIVLNLFDKEGFPEGRRLTIIVGGRLVEAQTMAKEFPGLDEARWYVDRRQQAFRQLGLSGPPGIYGIREDGIAWSLGGAFELSEMRAIVSAWLKE